MNAARHLWRYRLDPSLQRIVAHIENRLGRCQMGHWGCRRRAVGTWDLDGFRARLCHQCWDQISVDGELLGQWAEDAA